MVQQLSDLQHRPLTEPVSEQLRSKKMKESGKFLLVIGVLAIAIGFALGEPPQSMLAKSIIQPSVCDSGCDCGCQQGGECICSVNKVSPLPIVQNTPQITTAEYTTFVGTTSYPVQQRVTQQQFFLPPNNNSWGRYGSLNQSTPIVYYNRGVSAPVFYNQSRFFSVPPPRNYRQMNCPGGNCR